MAPHYQDDDIIIHKLKCGPYDNNAYVIVCPQTNESIVIDTPPDAEELVAVAKATDVKAILITHNHMDHIQSFAEVVSALGAPVGIGEPDAHALPTPADFFLLDGEEVKAGTVSLKAIFTPGHTPGSTCLTMGRRLFTGDTLFPGGPGKSGTPKKLKQIIDSITGKLFVLAEDVIFYPGHGDDGDLSSSRADYRVYASRQHPAELCGDVEWTKS